MLTLADLGREVVPVLAIAIGGGIAFVAVFFGIIHNIMINTSREKSRREIAAYVAEGSMTPEEGERLLNAGKGEGTRNEHS